MYDSSQLGPRALLRCTMRRERWCGFRLCCFRRNSADRRRTQCPLSSSPPARSSRQQRRRVWCVECRSDALAGCCGRVQSAVLCDESEKSLTGTIFAVLSDGLCCGLAFERSAVRFPLLVSFLLDFSVVCCFVGSLCSFPPLSSPRSTADATTMNDKFPRRATMHTRRHQCCTHQPHGMRAAHRLCRAHSRCP